MSLLLAAACTGAPEDPTPSGSIDRTVFLMGTEAQIQVEATDRGAALSASEDVLLSLEVAEQRLTTWDPEGELAQVNAGAAPTVTLAADLQEAQDWTNRTEGAFEARCASLVAAWGLRGEARQPSESELAEALATPNGWDEGGFGKGAALRDAALTLSKDPNVQRAQVNLGGQWLLYGPGEFELAIAHPDQREQSIGHLHIPAGSVATSGNSERGIVVDGQRIGHILDPRTGYPATDFGSITVVHADPFAADCLSTALLVLGPERALAWANEDPSFGVVIAERQQPDGFRIRTSKDLEPHFKTTK
ncbi:MAG: FAD:protein FMN transferase [Planctomycetes bacterium]|nr:FAD:protein FMN transferase [Planctomycetota bacterium]